MQSEEARRRRLVRRLLASSALSAALFGGEAHAQDDSAATFGGGLFVGYTFGSGEGFTLGAEGFGTYRFDLQSCSSDPRSGVGGSLQLALIGFRDVRTTIAGHAGGEVLRSALALSGELGASYRFGDHRGFGIHTGLLAESVLVYGAFRQNWLMNDLTVGGGARFPGTYGFPGGCAAGRPLRTRSGIARLGPTSTVVGRAPRRRGRERIAELGVAWERDAQMECASVPAFHQLAADLLEHGAPLSVVERALDAADDEMRHAILCASLASRHLGRVVRPTLPAAEGRPALVGLPGLARLATESWLDGCLAEGFAAAHAAAAAAQASDPEARAAQCLIARDEARHAELAWSVLAFALEAGGDDVRDEIRALRNVECLPAAPEFAPEGLETHGRVGARALDDASREHVIQSRRRMDRAYAYARAGAP